MERQQNNEADYLVFLQLLSIADSLDPADFDVPSPVTYLLTYVGRIIAVLSRTKTLQRNANTTTDLN